MQQKLRCNDSVDKKTRGAPKRTPCLTAEQAGIAYFLRTTTQPIE